MPLSPKGGQETCTVMYKDLNLNFRQPDTSENFKKNYFNFNKPLFALPL